MFPAGDIRIEIVNGLRRVNTDNKTTRMVLQSFLPTIAALQQAEGEESQ